MQVGNRENSFLRKDNGNRQAVPGVGKKKCKIIFGTCEKAVQGGEKHIQAPEMGEIPGKMHFSGTFYQIISGMCGGKTGGRYIYGEHLNIRWKQDFE